MRALCRRFDTLKRSERGFALPSVLMIVTILSLLALSVLGLKQFSTLLVISDVMDLRADYASESGIARLLAALNSADNLAAALMKPAQTYSFEDGAHATVSLRPWGMFMLATSNGNYRRKTHDRLALVADRPSTLFDNALVFANSSHQLIFAGGSSVKGKVILGEPGFSTGSTKNHTAPMGAPIRGTVEKMKQPKLPPAEMSRLEGEIKLYEGYLALTKGAPPRLSDEHIVRFSGGGLHVLARGSIADSVERVIVDGSLSLSDSLSRRRAPLYITSSGNVILRDGLNLRGTVAIVSGDSVIIEKGASLDDGVVIFSRRFVLVQQGEEFSGQLISPSITLAPGAYGHYPAALVSISQSDTARQQISMLSGAAVEGIVCLISPFENTKNEKIIELFPSARIIGACYTNSCLTLDGTVIGTVLTKEFYFYESPTAYLGWLRSGRVDRSSLPDGFLLPPGFSDKPRLDVLDWL